MIKALLFDLNGTLIDICTSESDDQVYRATANFLSYSGVYLAPEKLKELYFELNHEQRAASPEKFPEFDIAAIFRDVISRYSRFPLSDAQTSALADQASVVFRAASRFRLELYPDVKKVLDSFQGKYRMAAVSDGQSLWAVPELRAVGLEPYFSEVIVSGDFGFRKPDPRMYAAALEKMDILPGEAVYIGNDMYRDVAGAAGTGMKTVFFKSNQGDHSFHGVEPDYIIYRFSELPQAITFLETRCSDR